MTKQTNLPLNEYDIHEAFAATHGPASAAAAAAAAASALGYPTAHTTHAGHSSGPGGHHPNLSGYGAGNGSGPGRGMGRNDAGLMNATQHSLMGFGCVLLASNLPEQVCLFN